MRPLLSDVREWHRERDIESVRECQNQLSQCRWLPKETNKYHFAIVRRWRHQDYACVNQIGRCAPTERQRTDACEDQGLLTLIPFSPELHTWRVKLSVRVSLSSSVCLCLCIICFYMWCVCMCTHCLKKCVLIRIHTNTSIKKNKNKTPLTISNRPQ